MLQNSGALDDKQEKKRCPNLWQALIFARPLADNAVGLCKPAMERFTPCNQRRTGHIGTIIDHRTEAIKPATDGIFQNGVIDDRETSDHHCHLVASGEEAFGQQLIKKKFTAFISQIENGRFVRDALPGRIMVDDQGLTTGGQNRLPFETVLSTAIKDIGVDYKLNRSEKGIVLLFERLPSPALQRKGKGVALPLFGKVWISHTRQPGNQLWTESSDGGVGIETGEQAAHSTGHLPMTAADRR